MAHDKTASEFEQMFMDDLLSSTTTKDTPAPQVAPSFPVQPSPQPVVERVVEVQTPEKTKTYRPPVEKVEMHFPGFPFEMNRAKEKGYLNILFSKFSKAYLYYAQIEKFVRFCQAHGDEFLAYLKSQGVK